MFRRKDEAYDTDDLLQDVMSGIEDDEAVESAAPAATSAEATAAQSTAKTEAEKAPAASYAAPYQSTTQSTQAAPAASGANAALKASPAAAFRAQATQPANRNMPAAALSSADRSVATINPMGAAPKASKRVLTVGHDIHMKGEISTCDRLVIEGSVDATLSDVHTVEIAQTGSFKGIAEIEDAEISGIFEGDLIVNGRLTIYASGRVSGNVAYGEIEIERGGKLTGTIKTAEEMKAGRSGQPMKKAA